MKKQLLSVFILTTLLSTFYVNAQRYRSEIFTDVTVTHDVVYGWNWSVLLKYTQGGPIFPDSLEADIYEPVGDPLTSRPTIFFAHPGSGFPIFFNFNCVGDKTDSSIAEMCRQFARRGYTAVAYNYRLGWNPNSPDQDIRSGSLLQAAGRVIQDQKACIRFFRNEAMGANTYHMDPNKFIMGGGGSGGTFTFAYATVHDYADISLFKFLSATTDTTFHFTAGVTYFDSTYWGSVDGYGGNPTLNHSGNTPGVDNTVQFVWGQEGLIPDSNWMRAGDPPMVAFQCPADSLDPWDCGPVYNFAGYITSVCGSHTIVLEANGYNNNIAFQNNTWNDPYTLQARAFNGTNPNLDGLYPLVTPDDQQAPWEWWDSLTCYQVMMGGLGFTQGHADSVWMNSVARNPNMSKSNALLYIDTIMGYLNPRIIEALGLDDGVNDLYVLEQTVSVYPNPASQEFSIMIPNGVKDFSALDLFDISGRRIKTIPYPSGNTITINSEEYDPGIYMIRMKFAAGEVTRKVVIYR